MAEDPRLAGESVAQGIPGVGILQMLQQLGTKLPGGIQQIMQMLGAQQQQPPPLNAPLPRHGGFDAQGRPIIIPPGQ